MRHRAARSIPVYLTELLANHFSALKVALLAQEPKEHQQVVESTKVLGYAQSFSVGPNDFIDTVLSEDLPTQHNKKYVTSLVVEVP